MSHRATSEAAGRDLLARARHGSLVGVDAEGLPVLRTLHHALLGDGVYFHGREGGGKAALVGGPAVFECVEVIATVPSYWVDPVRACPATTYYRSVQVHGTLTRVESPEEKAAVLRSLMERLQPEGGYAPLTHDATEYAAAVRGLAVHRLSMDRVTARENVGRKRGQAALHRILAGLWQRGAPGDVAAIETILDARADVPRPGWLLAPGGLELVVHPTPERAEEAAALLVDTYWNGMHTRDVIAEAQPAATAWVGLRDPATRRLVGTAAALTNHTKHGWIFDVAVHPDHRGRGAGTALLERLLDHPAVRRVRLLSLRTRDAHDFYRRFGFTDPEHVPNPSRATTMLRLSPRDGHASAR